MNAKDPPPSARPLPRALPLLKAFAVFFAFALAFSVAGIYISRYAVSAASFGRSRLPCFVAAEQQRPVDAIERWLRPPESLLHSMTDEELLWRASLVPQVERYPFRRVPKVAFMFLIKGPLPLSPLWEKFFQGNERFYSVYVHALPSHRDNFTADSVFFRRQIPSKVTEWGQMSLCDAERRLLANALLDFSNEWFVLLSESCIPLYKFSIIYQYLKRSRHSFVRAVDEPGRDGRGRYNSMMMPEVDITEWRKGYQWFEVNRKLAVNIVKDSIYYPKFEKFCRPNCYADEHYFPTMLTIESPSLLANRSVTWVDWSRGGAHPASFGRADITESFLESIRREKNCTFNNLQTSMCFLFARKFTPSSLEPLLELAPTLLGFG